MTKQPAYPFSLRKRPLWLYAVVGAFLLLALTVGVPAWASTAPSDIEQGTVPPPRPTQGNPGGGGNNDDTDEDEEVPEATATPQPELPSPGILEGTPSPYTGVVTAPRLNVRRGPGTAFQVIGRLFEGETVQILFRNTTGDWWYTCCISGTTTSGWVSALFVRPDFDATRILDLVPEATNIPTLPAVAAADGANRATVATTGRLNVRSTSSITGTLLGKLESRTVVNVLARNARGDWWYVCCIPNTSTEGWVASRYLSPSFPAASANALLPVYGQTGAMLPTPAPATAVAIPTAVPTTTTLLTASPTLTETETSTATAEATTTLEISVSQIPTLAVQGFPVAMAFVITNTGEVTAVSVELRNELPDGLALNKGSATQGAQATAARTPSGTDVFAFVWPQVAPGDAVTATVQITISTTLTDGIVLDNLAAISAANVPAKTVRLSIALPPAGLPDFR